MSKTYEKSKFIEYLRETPLVSFACKKVGISRATYYRWFKDDKDFRESIEIVLRQGRENINDLAKATLIKMIKESNFNAIRFWLQHNDVVFRPVRTEYVDPNSDPKKKKYIGLSHGVPDEAEMRRMKALFPDPRKPIPHGNLSEESIQKLEKVFPDLKGTLQKDETKQEDNKPKQET